MTYDEKLQAIIDNPTAMGFSPCAPILAMFLRGFKPIIPPGPSDNSLTSQEIQTALEQAAPFDLNEIARMMLFMGYQIYVDSNTVTEWAMRLEYLDDPEYMQYLKDQGELDD